MALHKVQPVGEYIGMLAVLPQDDRLRLACGDRVNPQKALAGEFDAPLMAELVVSDPLAPMIAAVVALWCWRCPVNLPLALEVTVIQVGDGC